MNNPKEKAKELVDKYIEMEYLKDFHGMYQPLAKQCALIAVDEIIQQCWDYMDIDLEASYDYWQQVKQEIELL
jgi:hypothetical protein